MDRNDTDQPGRVKDPAIIPDTTPPSVASDGYDVLLRPRYPFRATPPSVEPRASLGLFVAVSIPRCPASAHQDSREAFDPAADHLAFHAGALVRRDRAIWPSLVTDLSAASGVAFHPGALVHHHRAIWPSIVTDLSAVSGVAFHAG